MGIGMQQILIVLVIAMVVFGASKLPQIGEGMGKAIRNFKKSVNTDDLEDITPKKITEKTEDNPTKEA
jgi:sec-independent protein translocase protein TatA